MEESPIAQSTSEFGYLNAGVVVCKKKIVRWSHKPYIIRCSHPTETIAAVGYEPVNRKISTPEYDVIEGGYLFDNHVTFRLTPVRLGKWGCVITILGKVTIQHRAYVHSVCKALSLWLQMM
jgi:hypothetical protein